MQVQFLSLERASLGPLAEEGAAHKTRCSLLFFTSSASASEIREQVVGLAGREKGNWIFSRSPRDMYSSAGRGIEKKQKKKEAERECVGESLATA